MKKLVAILAMVLVVPLVVAAAGCSGGGDEEEAAPAPAEAASPADIGAAGGGGGAVVGAPASAEPAPAAAEESLLVGQQSSSLPSVGPKVIQTASLRVVVPRGRFEEAIDQARTIAAGVGGFVTGSTASQGKDGRLVRGTLVLRVPDESYARVMGQLGRLGKVEGREESGQDVSAQFVDLEARARHLEAVERQLLELLGRATNVSAALAVQSQLNAVQLELEQVRGQLRYLDDQVSYSTVSLDLRERFAAVATSSDDAWGIVDAWRDGARGFVRVVGGVFVVLATAAPVLLILGGLLVAGRLALVARRRERTEAAPPA